MKAFAISNPVNLARVISTGVIGPRALYGTKHRPDGTDIAGGRLLLHDAVPDLYTLQRIGRPTDLVIVELEGVDLSPWEGSKTLDGVLPIDTVVAVHFPSESAAKEFVTTPFANVDPQALPVEATPSWFEAAHRPITEQTQPLLIDTSSAENLPSSALSDDHVRFADRVVGALLEILVPVVASTKTLEVARRAIAALEAGDPPVRELLAPAVADRSYFEEVENRLIGLDHGQLETRRILSELADGAPERNRPSLERAVRVAKNREDLGDLNSWNDTVALALLISLMAESPESIRDQYADAVSHGDTLGLALWFSGLRRGHARRPNESRVPGVQDIGIRLLTNIINRRTGEGPTSDLSAPPLDVHRQDDEYVYRLLTVPPAVVGVRRIPTPMERITELDGSRRVALARRLGIPVSTELVIEEDGRVTSELNGGCLHVRIVGSHSVECHVDEEALVAELGELDDERLVALADEVAPIPETAP